MRAASELGLQDLASSFALSSPQMQHVVALQRRQQQQLRRVLHEADVVIEVLDARLPLAYRCAGLERWVLRHGKKLVLLLNKVDLVPSQALAAWLRHLQRASPAPVLAFKCPHSGSAVNRGAKAYATCTAVDPLQASQKLKR